MFTYENQVMFASKEWKALSKLVGKKERKKADMDMDGHNSIPPVSENHQLKAKSSISGSGNTVDSDVSKTSTHRSGISDDFKKFVDQDEVVAFETSRPSSRSFSRFSRVKSDKGGSQGSLQF